MSDKPKVRVTIYCTEKVRYAITRDLPASVVAEYEEAEKENRDEQWFCDFGERYLDRDRDWLDADDLEDVRLEREPASPDPVQ